MLDDVGDGVPVRRPGDERAQDQHVERALHHLSVGLLVGHELSPRRSMGRNDTPLDCLWEVDF
jgi:hypothetical protein